MNTATTPPPPSSSSQQPQASSVPPSLPSAAAGLPNKFRKMALAGCIAVVALLVIIIASCALSRSPAEACLDSANDARAAILEGRADDLYEMLPPSWRKDLDGQLQLLAAKIDETTFQQITGLAGDLADLGEEKEDLILEWMREEFDGDGPVNDKEGVRDLIGALRVISKWKHSDLRDGRFRRLFGDCRVAAFLSGIIRKSMEQDGVSASEFSLVDPKQKDVVTLRVTTTERRYDGWDDDSDKPRYNTVTEEKTLDWVLFEDCWVPRDLLFPECRDEGWRGGMEEARRAIQDISPRDIAQLSGGLAMVRVVLPQLRACQSVRDVRRLLRDLDLD